MKREFSVLSSDGVDEAFFVQLSNERAGNGAVNLELFNKHRASDAKNLGDFVHQLLITLSVQENVVVKLVLDLDLSPALLFSFST